MPDYDPESTIDLFRQIDSGDNAAVEKLYQLVFDELHQRANDLFRNQPANHTLQATALVNDAFVDIVGSQNSKWENKKHFVNAAARAMRFILVDHARAKGAEKRGGGHNPVTLSGVSDLLKGRRVDVLALEEALGELEQQDKNLAQIVELRFYGGLTAKEVGEVMGATQKKVEADWYYARAWLRRALKNDAE